MELLFLALQLAAVDSIYSSPSLRRLVETAAVNNRTMPATIRAYRARVGSEVVITYRQGVGIEAPVSIEQLNSEVRWSRHGDFEQHVLGDRLMAAGPQLTVLSFMRQSLLIPHLYGNQIALLFGRDTGRRSANAARTGRRVVAVHPLGEDRDRTYRFSGGDTVVIMRVDGRSIPVARVTATPREELPAGTVAFAGQLFLDVTRAHLVGLRGRFFTVRDTRGLADLATAVAGVEGALYVDVENAEVANQVWLPSRQRFEAQLLFRISSDTRSVFRVSSMFRDYALDFDSTSILTHDDSLVAQRHLLTLAPTDSLSRFTDWTAPLGEVTAGARAEDFDDVAPDEWRGTGRPLFSLRASRLNEFLHVNRVEGWYTGAAADFRARDALPGFRAHGFAGWAWQERVMRGAINVSMERGRNRFSLHGGRTLDMTNDFRPPLDSGSTLGALLGADDYDYVARDVLGTSWRRSWGRKGNFLSLVELADVRDVSVARHMKASPLGLGSSFRLNRGVDDGRYVRTVASLDINPGVTVGFVEPGVGLQWRYQGGSGNFQYERIEAEVVARTNGDALTAALRIDGGVLLGERIPAQQLFEVGSTQNLAGYGYKAFAGNQAVVARALVLRWLPFGRAPLRLGSRLVLPPAAPALSASAQAAWVGIKGRAAVDAMHHLLPPLWPGAVLTSCSDRTTPMRDVLSQPTCGWRTSVAFGVRFFGGTVGIEIARPADRHRSWRIQFGIGQVL